MAESTQRSLWPLLLVIGLVCFTQLKGCDLTSATPLTAPKGPDLVPVFAANSNRSEASAHAHALATICDSLADVLEFDGKRTDPRVRAGVHVDDLRIAIREYRMKGWSFLNQYPALRPAMEKFFDDRVGASGGPIDEKKRADWVRALRDLGESAEYAAQRG